VTITIRLSGDLNRQLEDAASFVRRSVSNAIEVAVEQWLERSVIDPNSTDNDLAEWREHQQECVGRQQPCRHHSPRRSAVLKAGEFTAARKIRE
jgi:predicted transcriptional regulator